jgi:NAD(P)-dependent dehydrogenase (short-subunit alcohol dehydrogenase family)
LKTLAANFANGRVCIANIGLAATGLMSQMTLEGAARIFAALATGFWFLTQSVLAIRSKMRSERMRKG